MTQPLQGSPPTPLFTLLRDLVHERTGVFFSNENVALFLGKVDTVRRESGCDGLLDYYHMLQAEDPAGPEMQRLISEITVGETWFFREMPQLDVLMSTVLPRLLEDRDTNDDPIRIWSVACASGEEPLTLAMMIDQAHPEWFSRITILATDINRTAISRARSGLFRERSFRNTSPSIRKRYFKSAVGVDNIDPAILARVDFRTGSLLDTKTAQNKAPFDLILCRNVLIYFDERSTLAAMSQFGELLRPDAYLLLGSSESLLRYSIPWTLKEIEGAFFYEHRADESQAELERT